MRLRAVRPIRPLHLVGLLIGASVLRDESALAAAPRGHYEVGPDVVLDLRTQLEWERRPEPSTPITLADALSACNRQGGWRVPTARELETLVDVRASSAPAWDRTAFGEGGGGADPPPIYWTLTRTIGTSASSLVVDFRPERLVHALDDSEFAFVRCVRGPR